MTTEELWDVVYEHDSAEGPMQWRHGYRCADVQAEIEKIQALHKQLYGKAPRVIKVTKIAAKE